MLPDRLRPRVRPVHLLTVVALGTLGVCLPALASDPGLHVTVTGLKHDGATVRCALFAHADGFPKDGAAAVTATGSVTGGRATCSFPTLPSGTYALAAFEDRNGNGRLDRNALGFPVEGYAFSRDARGRFGPPKFDAAAFAHDGGKNTLQLRAAY